MEEERSSQRQWSDSEAAQASPESARLSRGEEGHLQPQQGEKSDNFLMEIRQVFGLKTGLFLNFSVKRKLSTPSPIALMKDDTTCQSYTFY